MGEDTGEYKKEKKKKKEKGEVAKRDAFDKEPTCTRPFGMCACACVFVCVCVHTYIHMSIHNKRTDWYETGDPRQDRTLAFPAIPKFPAACRTLAFPAACLPEPRASNMLSDCAVAAAPAV